MRSNLRIEGTSRQRRPTFDRSAQERRSAVPVALRAPAPGQCERWALRRNRLARRHKVVRMPGEFVLTTTS